MARHSTEVIEVFSTDMLLMWIFVVLIAGMGLFFGSFPIVADRMPDAEAVFAAFFLMLFVFACAGFLHWFGRRHHGKVVSIGPQGIFDRRTMTRPVNWEEVRQFEVLEVYIKGACLTMIGLDIADIDGVNKREMGMVGEAMKTAMGIPAITVQTTGLKPSEPEAMAAFLRHLPEVLHKPAPPAD